jgi:SAM-dependent methyltransferase
VSGFTTDWLALREPYDRQARNEKVLDAVVAAMSALPSITVVDLACGTGATLRALEPRLPAHQNWRLVDNDLSLLARAAESPRQSRTTVSATPIDLAFDLEAALDGAVDLVTTSALLDLVSAEWLERLTTEIAARRLPFYAALSYDGRIAFEPDDPFDQRVVDAVNRHQQGDKGFGPALGPDAAAAAARGFQALGYAVTTAPADWTFGPADETMQVELLLGWATAAREAGGLEFDDLAGWLRRRQRLASARSSSIRVGHLDLFAQPPRE